MNLLNRILTRATEILVAGLLAAMAVALLLEVALRYGLGISLPWTSEFARYAMIWITFFGAALAIREREHIQVTFFIRLLPRSLWKYSLVFINVALMAFVAALIRYSVTIVSAEMSMRTAALNIPFGIVVAALPLSGFLMLVYLLADTGAILRNENVEFPEGEAP
jgi:TRAP-type C4-dicarboxylate transport system permease small subunit